MWKKLETTLREHRFIVTVALLAVVVIGALLATERILLAMIPEDGSGLMRDRLGFWVNVMTEVFGIGITVVIVERFNRRRATAQQREQNIKRIIREMRSPSAAEGVRAVMEASEIGLLEDGTLSGAKLYQADLSGADLWKANLSGTDLWKANLSKAHLAGADVSGADLFKANLSGARLLNANLSGARLLNANLSGANLTGADVSGTELMVANLSGANLKETNLSGADLLSVNLSGADLLNANLSGARLLNANVSGANLTSANVSGANLTGADMSGANLTSTDVSGVFMENANLSTANLLDAEFDEETFLPDITTWRPDIDMTRFTNPEHPNFWQASFVAAGFDTHEEWEDAHGPRPWVDAGYGENDWNEWVRDGKPTPEESRQQGRIPIWEAAGYDTEQEWDEADYPRPWVDAGYGENDWNEWVHDGKPTRKPVNRLQTRIRRHTKPIPVWKAADYDNYDMWDQADQPRPWLDAGYGRYDWNEWVRDGKPTQKPTNDPDT
ncbi:MAG: pentapeptide repeat-containing protein [Chloroflexota bacterium]